MRNKKATQTNTNILPQIRIIGGQWRSRKLNFAQIEGLRPTPDRVRETLFNWLQTPVPGAKCLDLFSGSGALGFEALSRGASHCTFIDIAQQSCKTLRENSVMLACTNAEIIQTDTLSWLQRLPDATVNEESASPGQPLATKFDIVFLDPPFNKGLCQSACQLLIDKNILNKNAYVYIETELRAEIIVDWTLHREKTAGQVHYRLYKVE